MVKKIFSSVLIVTFILGFMSLIDEKSYAKSDKIESRMYTYHLSSNDLVKKGEAFFIDLKTLNSFLKGDLDDSFPKYKTISKNGKSLSIRLGNNRYTDVFDKNQKNTYISSFYQEGKYYIELADVARFFNFKYDIYEKTENTKSKKYKIHRIPILMYHHIVDKAELSAEERLQNNLCIVTKQQFQDDMDELERMGVVTISMEDLYKHMSGIKKAPKNAIVITFDDGYLSTYKYAYPILKEKGFIATQFLIVKYVPENPLKWTYKSLPKISWLEANKSRDVFEFHSHSYDMHKLDYKNRANMATRSIDNIRSDLDKAHQLLKEHGMDNFKCFAFPYGMYRDATLRALKEMDTKLGFTVVHDYADRDDDLYELDRFTRNPYTTLENLQTIINDR